MDPLFVEAVLVAVYATLQVLVLYSVGCYATYTGFITIATLPKLAGFAIKVCLPLLTFSLLRSFDGQLLAESGLVFVVAVVHQLIGALLGLLCSVVFRIRSPDRQLLVMSVAYCNNAALPFVLTYPIVANWSRAQENPNAAAVSFAMIGLYFAEFLVSFFTVGKPVLQRLQEPGEQPTPKILSDKKVEGGRFWQLFKQAKTLFDPTLRGLLLALFIGCIPELKWVFVDGPLKWITGAMVVVADTTVGLKTMILGSSLYIGFVAQWRQRKARKLRQARIIATGKSSSGTSNGDRDDLPSFTPVIFWASFLKLIVVPAICLPLHTALGSAGIISNDPITQMILHIQSAVPSAQTSVSLLAAMDKPRLSARLAQLYVPQYLCSVFTVATVIIVGVQLIG